jgi:hypothetical protein
MVRLILILLSTYTLSAQADFLGFKTGVGFQSQIPGMSEKLKALEMKTGPLYEDQFNQLVKTIENRLEEEKLYCAGETADVNGKVLSADQKQLCFRELKGHYLETVEVIFEMKKKYLSLVHAHQVDRLSEIQKKLKTDIEKSF